MKSGVAFCVSTFGLFVGLAVLPASQQAAFARETPTEQGNGDDIQAGVDRSGLAMPETFYISLGGHSVFRADSTIALTAPNLGAGVSLDPAETLGLDIETTVVKIDGHYRFTPSSKLEFSWYRIDSDASKRLATDIDWVDSAGNPVTISAGSEVSSSLQYDIAKLSYFWSFYHNDKVELAFGGGFHFTRFEVDLNAVTDSNGVPVSQDSRRVAHTVPLPTIGIGLNYRVTPDLYWYLRAEGFYLAFDDWDGSFSEIQLGIEYNVWENLGVGAGLVSDRLNVTEETDQYDFSYDNQFSGINIFVSYSM